MVTLTGREQSDAGRLEITGVQLTPGIGACLFGCGTGTRFDLKGGD